MTKFNSYAQKVKYLPTFVISPTPLPPFPLQAKVKIKFGDCLCLTETSGRTKTTNVDNTVLHYNLSPIYSWTLLLSKVFQVSPYQNVSPHKVSQICMVIVKLEIDIDPSYL